MSELRLHVGSLCLVANCADELCDQARWLLETIKKLNEKGLPLEDRVRIQFGWSLLTLKRRDSEVIVCEPDYSGNPFSEAVDNVTRTLWVQALQVEVLRKLGLEGNPARFHDKIVTGKRCLDEPKVFLQRQGTQEPGDSGWFVGRVQENQETVGEYESLVVYKLLFRRPTLLQVLALPPDFVVVYDGDRIESILDPQDRPIWPTETPGEIK